MRMVAPRTGAPEENIGQEQEEYLQLTVAVYGDNGEAGPITLLTRWRPTEEELEELVMGSDVFIALQTHGQPMQPIIVQVGPEGWEVEG